MSGVVLGDRSRLAGTQADDDFRTTGLTHLVAVSGSHLVVVAALVSACLAAFRTPRILNLGATVLASGAYVVATGVQASAVRAWVMALIVAVALGSGRRSDPSAALCCAVCALLVSHPPVAFDLGFRLSVAAVAGLVAFGRLSDGWLAAILPAGLRWLSEPLALTFTAQAATLPLIASAFGTVSLVSPISNALVSPLVSLVWWLDWRAWSLASSSHRSGSWS
jgi:competence protein ComEC